jgi:two-component system response regulator
MRLSLPRTSARPLISGVQTPAPDSRAILIVDDDADAVTIMSAVVRKLRWQNPILTFNDGESVLDFFGRTYLQGSESTDPLPCVVLLDLKMPGLSGFDVLEWLQQHERFSGVVRVIVSTSDAPEDMNRAKRLGAHQFLYKFPHHETLNALLMSAGVGHCTVTEVSS